MSLDYLRDRPNGVKISAETNTKCKVVLITDGTMYGDYFVEVGQTGKNVMLAILKYMECDMNTICIGGDTMELISKHTGYNTQSIRDQLKGLYPMLEKSSVRGEYIVNPMFAYKGNIKDVYNTYELVEKERGYSTR